MMLKPLNILALGVVFAAPFNSQVAAQTDPFSELDAFSDVSANQATGVQFATEQAARGEYLEALATLERVLAVFPKSTDARLLHAIYLCRIDDEQGGLAEIAEMKEKVFGKELLEQARVTCVARPPLAPSSEAEEGAQ